MARPGISENVSGADAVVARSLPAPCVFASNRAPGSRPPYVPTLDLPLSIGWLRGRLCYVHHVLTVPDSIISYVLFTFLGVLVAVSVAAFLAETLPQYRDPRAPSAFPFFVVDAVWVAVFGTEFALRLVTAAVQPWTDEVPPPLPTIVVDKNAKKRKKQQGQLALEDAPPPPQPPPLRSCWSPAVVARKLVRFLVSPGSVLDILAVFPSLWALVAGWPTYVAAPDALLVVRALRLARVFRIVEVGGGDSTIALVGRALAASADVLGFLFILFLTVQILLSTAVFFCEAGSWDEARGVYLRPDLLGTGSEVSPFQSVPHTLWWSIVTMTTVGYGDMFPTTACGRTVGSVVILCGLLTLALPITVLGNNFTKEYDKRQKDQSAGSMALFSALLGLEDDDEGVDESDSDSEKDEVRNDVDVGNSAAAAATTSAHQQDSDTVGDAPASPSHVAVSESVFSAYAAPPAAPAPATVEPPQKKPAPTQQPSARKAKPLLRQASSAGIGRRAVSGAPALSALDSEVPAQDEVRPTSAVTTGLHPQHHHHADAPAAVVAAEGADDAGGSTTANNQGLAADALAMLDPGVAIVLRLTLQIRDELNRVAADTRQLSAQVADLQGSTAAARAEIVQLTTEVASLRGAADAAARASEQQAAFLSHELRALSDGTAATGAEVARASLAVGALSGSVDRASLTAEQAGASAQTAATVSSETGAAVSAMAVALRSSHAEGAAAAAATTGEVSRLSASVENLSRFSTEVSAELAHLSAEVHALSITFAQRGGDAQSTAAPARPLRAAASPPAGKDRWRI